MAPHCFFEHQHTHQIMFYRSAVLSWKCQLRGSGLVDSQWSIHAEGWWNVSTDGGISLTGADQRQYALVVSVICLKKIKIVKIHL